MFHWRCLVVALLVFYLERRREMEPLGQSRTRHALSTELVKRRRKK